MCARGVVRRAADLAFEGLFGLGQNFLRGGRPGDMGLVFMLNAGFR
jgi:hypothetical protein